jgi:colicin import membrane protein
MEAAAERPEFEPPPQPGLWRGIGLAVLAHLLLILALAWGLRWKSDSNELAAEAELWSALPQQAAPKEPAPEPPKEQPVPEPPKPVVREQPVPEPAKPVVREQPRPEPARREADIALEREKKRKEAEVRQARETQEALERERQKKLEAQRSQQELQQQKELQARLAAEKRQKEEEEKKRRETARQEEEARMAKMREENLKRIQAMAGGTGGPTSDGAAAQPSGPSAGWGAKVRARVKPNIVFTEAVSGNPEARVEVRLSPDGTIVSKRIVKSSGHKGWDDAVLRALDKTEVLPRDENGRVPTPVELIFRPKDLG